MRASWITLGLMAVMGLVTASLLMLPSTGPGHRPSAMADDAPERRDPANRSLAASGAPSVESEPDAAAPPSQRQRAVVPAAHDVLLTGRVVDDTGRGLRATVTARVHVERSAIEAAGQQLVLDQRKQAADPWRRGSAEALEKFHRRAAEIDERNRAIRKESILIVKELGAGRFEVRGETAARQLTVTAHVRDHPPAMSTFAVGSRDVRVVVHRIGSIAATLLYDPGISSHELGVKLKRGDTVIKNLVSSGARTPGRREFRAADIPVGIYSLELRLKHDPEPILVLPRLRIEAGAPCSDPRLRSIDIRQLCRRIVIQLKRPNGRPLVLAEQMAAEVAVRGPGGELIRPHPKLRKSRLVMRARHPYLDVAIELPSYEPLHFPVLDDSRTVYVQPRAHE